MERQTTYGWPVAIDLFLGGTGAGAFFAGLFLHVLEMPRHVIRFALTISPFLVLIGTLFLLADITARGRIYLLFSNFKSWTSRGAWILTIFLIAAFNYAFLSFPYIIFFPGFDNPLLASTTGAVAAVFSLLVMIYPGFLMGTMSSVPFWNTLTLPVLFLITGLSNGVAFLILISALFAESGLEEMLSITVPVLIILTLLITAALYIFLNRAAQGNEASKGSLKLLDASRFSLKFFLAGLFIPFCLLILALFTSKIFIMSALAIIAAILSLSGGLYLRYAIISAGVFLPRFSI